MNQQGNPIHREADSMCRILVREILHSQTWNGMQNIIDAIIRVRQQEKLRASEWEHLNPEPSTEGMA